MQLKDANGKPLPKDTSEIDKRPLIDFFAILYEWEMAERQEVEQKKSKKFDEMDTG